MTSLYSVSRRHGTVPWKTVARSASMTVLAAAGITAVARQRQRIATLEDNLHNKEKKLRDREKEIEHLVTKRLPALVESVRGQGVAIPAPLREPATDPTCARSLEMLLGAVEDAVRQTQDRAERSATHTLTGVLATVRGLAAEQHTAVSDMQHRHDDSDVLADLYTIDHTSSQLSRRLRALAVLGGAWIGQHRSATALHELIRGAQSQIRDYQRVDVTPHNRTPEEPSVDDLGVVSRAVEPLVLIVAELLDNAARYSPPYSQVAVGFKAAHNGVAITIDDAGVGMPAEERQRASRLFAQPVTGLANLDDPPRVGFAVIGLLAARYDITVSVDAPPLYGGVRAVVFVPNEQLAHIDPAPADTASESAASSTDAVQQHTASGLPKRSRRGRDTEPPGEVSTTSVPLSESAAGLAAWQQASATSVDTPSSETGKDTQA